MADAPANPFPIGVLKRIRHRLAHLTGWNLGKVEVWWTRGEPKRLMVGFRCSGCGKLMSISPCHGTHLAENLDAPNEVI